MIYKLLNYLKYIFGVLILIVAVVFLVKGATYYRVGVSTGIKKIDEFGTCKKVSSLGSSDLFIPTNTSTEWLSFLNNKSLGVSLAECYLINDIHTVADCTNSGGSVISSGSNDFCRFNNNSCPSGWTQYNSWSETVSKSCAGNNLDWTGLCPSGCDTGSHVFSDAGRETCRYNDYSLYTLNTCYSQQCASYRYPCGVSCSWRRGCSTNWCSGQSCVNVPYPCNTCQYGNGIDCTANTSAVGCY